MYLPQLWAASVAMVILVAIGGLLYTGGAVVYAMKRPNPWPAPLRLPRDLPRLHGARVPVPLDGVPDHRDRSRLPRLTGAQRLGSRRRRRRLGRRLVLHERRPLRRRASRRPRSGSARDGCGASCPTPAASRRPRRTRSRRSPNGPGVTRSGSTTGVGVPVTSETAMVSAANVWCIVSSFRGSA